MLDITIPGPMGKMSLEHLVLDYNGTIALDGVPLPGILDTLLAISQILSIHIVTADTFGLAQQNLKGYPFKLTILESTNQAEGKLEYIKELGTEKTVTIGNGLNDRLMLKASKLGITVNNQEGLSVSSLLAADINATDILAALKLFLNPKRLIATLRD